MFDLKKRRLRGGMTEIGGGDLEGYGTNLEERTNSEDLKNCLLLPHQVGLK